MGPPLNPIEIHKNPEEGIVFLGRNLSEFPCFRSSFMTGIFSGVAGGMLYFLYSSKPVHSSHAGFGTFVVATIGYWTVCRYNYYKAKIELIETAALLNEKANIRLLNIDEKLREKEEREKQSS